MPQLYKHNKGKWLLPSVVSKNTASNEEKWRSLRRRPVMCHWASLSPKINRERGLLWLRCGHPWSINPPPSPSSSCKSTPRCLPHFFSQKTLAFVGTSEIGIKWEMSRWNVWLGWLLQSQLQRRPSMVRLRKKAHPWGETFPQRTENSIKSRNFKTQPAVHLQNLCQI